MADKKISALDSATAPLAGTEVLPIVQSSTTKKVAVSDLTAGRAVSALSVTATSTGEFGTSLKISQASSPTCLFYSTAVNSSSRNWAWTVNNQVFGDMVLYTSNAINGDPVAAGTARAYFDRLGGVTFGGVTSAGSGNVRLDTGNVIIGTAGKGVDFSANTNAAGMTSELLNWYEEGTWTPVVSASSGTITAYTATGKYTRIGRAVILSFKITITTNGTGSGTLFVDGVPFNAAASSSDGGAGRESANSGYGFVMTFGTTSRLYINKADAGYPGANGDILAGTITYTV